MSYTRPSDVPIADPPAERRSPATVFAEASALAAAGKFHDAVALATTENRRARDPQLEYWLVRWRHQAFEPRDARGPADWPPRVPTCFADAVPPPEIPASELTAQTLAAGILEHGCLIVRGLLSTDDAVQLAEGMDQAFNAFKAARARAPLRQTLPWYAPFREGDLPLAKQRYVMERFNRALWTADSPRMLFDLIEVFERRRVLDVIQEHLGERPILSVEKATLRRVPGETAGDWHQDGRFLGPEIRAVNVWLALTDCGVDSPGLEILPRRIPYIVESGTHGALADWTIGRDKVVMEAGATPFVSPVFAAGDALLFDHLFLHRTGGRPGMTGIRRAIESWFFAPSAMPAHHAITL